jgi:hypothetical protein
MTMSWMDDMRADAAALAFPAYAFLPDDEIELEVDFSPGYHYSSITWADPSFEISVQVKRRGKQIKAKFMHGEEAGEFMTALMKKGSERGDPAGSGPGVAPGAGEAGPAD